MSTAIGYQSYMVRLWYGTEHASTLKVVLPSSDDTGIPPWLRRAIAGDPLHEQLFQRACDTQEDLLLFYAEVEHVQSGERRTFDAMDGLLEFLRRLIVKA